MQMKIIAIKFFLNNIEFSKPYIVTGNDVNQLLFACEKFHCRKYFLLRTSINHIVVIKETGLDEA